MVSKETVPLSDQSDAVTREQFEAVQQNCRALYAQRNRYREALEKIAAGSYFSQKTAKDALALDQKHNDT